MTGGNRRSIIAAAALGLIIVFGGLAQGGRDLWAATPIYLAVLLLTMVLFFLSAWPRGALGWGTLAKTPLGLLAAALAVSSATAVKPGESFVALLDWLAALAAFCAALNIFHSEESVSAFLWAAAPIVWIELAVDLYQRGFHNPFLYPVAGTLVNANIATQFLIFWIAPLWAAARREQERTGRWMNLMTATFAAAVLNVLLFNSLWGFFCLLLIAAAILPQKRPIAALTALAAAAIAIKFGKDASRAYWWASGLKMFAARPISGVGIGNYASAFLTYKAGGGQNTLFAHSFPIQMLAETGILGFGALAYALWFLGRTAAHRLKFLNARSSFAVGAGAALVYSLINPGMEFLLNLVVFWVFLGIILAPSIDDDDRAIARRSTVIAACAFAAAAVAFILPPFLASRNCVAAEERLRGGDAQGAAREFSDAAEIFGLSSEAQEGWARALFRRYQTEHDRTALNHCLEHQLRAIALDRLNADLRAELGRYQSAASVR